MISKTDYDGALAYAAADKSDPFTLRRALTHISLGITGYSAEPHIEIRRLPEGQTFSNGESTYPVTVYRNVGRP